MKAKIISSVRPKGSGNEHQQNNPTVMKKNKIFILTFLCLAAFATFSCSKDDDNVYVEPARRNLLIERSNGSTKTIYQYDSNYRLISEELFSGGESYGGYQYTYDSEGKLFRATNGSTVRIDYAYTEDQVQSIIVYQYNGLEMALVNSYSYLYADNQITEYFYGPVDNRRSVYRFDPVFKNLLDVKVYLLGAGELTGTYLKTTTYNNYDNQKNPCTDLPFLGFPEKQIHNPGIVSVEGETPYSYTYEYNADGYPTKRTKSTGTVDTYKYQRL